MELLSVIFGRYIFCLVVLNNFKWWFVNELKLLIWFFLIFIDLIVGMVLRGVIFLIWLKLVLKYFSFVLFFNGLIEVSWLFLV